MRLSIKTLLAGLFGLLAVLALGQGILGLNALSRIDTSVKDLTGNWMPSIEAVGSLRNTVAVTRSTQYRYMTSVDEADRLQAVEELEMASRSVANARKVYEPLITEGAERQLYNEFLRHWEDMQAAWNTVLSTDKAGRHTEAMTLFRGDARKPFRAATEALTRDVALNREGGLASAALANATQDSARLTTMVTLAIVLAAALGAAAFGFLGVSRPIARMTEAMRRLADGDAATEVPGAGRRDEIGAMAATLVVFKDNLIRSRKLEQETELARAGAEAQRKAAMREMADGFEQAVGSVIGMVSAAATELQGTAQAMSATAGETASQSTTVAAAAEEAASNVNTVAAAAEQLGSSVQEIGRQVGGSAELASAAVTEAGHTAELVQTLSEAAAEIGNVVALISSIAGQTNLLALNATIEAARAGEAGRGFAVVASEVKELASQTARATDEISTQIARIQGSTGQAVTAIGAITSRIREISGVATSLSAAVEEQGAATQEIVRNVAQAAIGAGEVTSNIAGVAAAADETGAAASQVLASASELSRQSEHLQAEVKRFLGTVRAA